MFRFLLSRRWLSLFALGLVLAVVFVRLGMWQLERGEARAERNDRVVSNTAAAPVPLSSLTSVGARPAEQAEWRTVTVTGRYDAESTVLWRNRVLDRTTGYHVVVPLVTEDGTVAWVDRGFVPRPGSADGAVDVPAPPAGEVTVTGRLRSGDQVSEAGLQRSERPAPSVTRLDPLTLGADLSRPVVGGYVERLAESPAPAEAPQVLPDPDLEPGPHLAYAFQWFVFTVIGVVGLVVLVRREARDRSEEHARAASGDGADDSPRPGATPAPTA